MQTFSILRSRPVVTNCDQRPTSKTTRRDATSNAMQWKHHNTSCRYSRFLLNMTGDSRPFDPRFFELSTTLDCSFSPATYSGTVHNDNKHPLSRRTPTLQQQQTNLFERCYNVRHLCSTIPRNHTTRLAAVGHHGRTLDAIFFVAS